MCLKPITMQYNVLEFLVKIEEIILNVFPCAIALNVAKDSIITVLCSYLPRKYKIGDKSNHSFIVLK